MANEILVREVIKATRRRAVVETAAAAFIAAIFTKNLTQNEPGSVRFFGYLTVIAAACFIVAVVWRAALSEQLLREHPAEDTAFWRAALGKQARLLRLVPLWYLGPLLLGLILIAMPLTSRTAAPLLSRLIMVAVVFAAIAWLNLWAAKELERKSSMLGP